MILLKTLLNEVLAPTFFKDKIALNLPTIIAKDIKEILSPITVWQFRWPVYYFDPNHSSKYKKLVSGGKDTGFMSIINVITKSDYEKALNYIKNPKSRNRLQSFVYPNFISDVLAKDNFLDFLIKHNSYDLYKSTFKDIFEGKFDSFQITADLWNGDKQSELISYRIEGAYYHVSLKDNLKPGEEIKPYFNSEKYVKNLTKGLIGGYAMQDAFKVIEEVLEKNRPSNMPSRNNSTFIFKTLDDAIEYLHGGDRPIYAIKPKGEVIWVDMNWVDEMNYEFNSYAKDMEDIYDKDDEDEIYKSFSNNIENIAKKYWSMKPTNDPVWEGITKNSIEIIKRVK